MRKPKRIDNEEKQAIVRAEQSRDLSLTLANKINQEFAAYSELTGEVLSLGLNIENARIRLGVLLAEAKDSIGHGKFMQWVEANVRGISHRSCTNFIAFAKAAGGKELQSLDSLKDYHKILIRLGLKEAPEGHGVQVLHDFNAFAAVTKTMGAARKTFDEVFERRPLTEWNADEKEQLKSQLEPVVEVYNKL
jgi:DUF3102 family protein